MRAVFFGTPEWAVPSLEAFIASDVEVVAVVTNPDRPAGRKLELHAPPVKEAAIGAGLEVLQPEKARDELFLARLKEIGPDVAPVVAYGKILPPSVLQVPSFGFVNLHFSLLPAYRGAAPVQRALIEGETVTGASVMVLTEGMDEGPVLGATEAEIAVDDTAGSLGDRLSRLGAPLLVECVEAYVAGDLEPAEQDHDAASYADKITSADARIDWAAPPERIRNLIRGLNPSPGAWTTFKGLRVKVLRADLLEGHGEPGRIVDPSRLIVGTGEGLLQLTEVQPSGKRAMTGEDFARGHRPAPDEAFE